MDRREALKAVMSAACVPGATATVVEASKPLFVAVISDFVLTKHQRRQLEAAFAKLWQGMDRLPVVILPYGVHVSVVEAP